MSPGRRSASHSFDSTALEAAVAELGSALDALRAEWRLKQARAQGTSRAALRGKALTGKLSARPSATGSVAPPFEPLAAAPVDGPSTGPLVDDWVPLLEMAGHTRPEPPVTP